ncbi:MAG: aspartate--tRNA(Asn) ligase [Candidatus Micrarchaeota archaeon]|nr:aspartate--tRNA(Asn) ligase [Candidatus Micrarchaeota archaeon]MDE1848134.1 aspartate--tRNA(Asn) ligase [Candidatus Micrarchaeota archaeon]MDE1864789.1 aspartate--tRNA(Asn) ligase [Candidatus Micrarchaeota archaeon]
MLRTHYVAQLKPEMENRRVKIAGWLHEVRNIGKISFMQVRDHTGIAQVTAKLGDVGEEIIKSTSMPKESVIAVTGIVKRNPQSKSGFEIIPEKILNLNPLEDRIPFDVTSKVPAELDVRLNYRHIDLRRLETTSVFNIESTVLSTFRGILLKQKFQEMRTPTIVDEATEGGAELFGVKYFEKTVYLAQSPQLYKQLAVIGGMDKVFMVLPVFRAEKFDTPFHLNEATQMDIEMGFADHNDAIKVLVKVASGIEAEVIKKNAPDLERLGHKLEKSKPVVVTYKKALQRLNENDHKLEFGNDFSREHETALSELYGDMLVVKEYPTAIRAFYSMPNKKDPEISNSYDLLYKGLEISSGAQRIHISKLLEEQMLKRGMNPKNFEFYLTAFKQGAPPHAGWSIGLERFVMKLSGMQNIREASMFPRDRNRVIP